MKTYTHYEHRRAALLERAKEAGIKNPAGIWPKLPPAKFYNGIYAPYWAQEQDMESAIQLAELKKETPRR